MKTAFIILLVLLSVFAFADDVQEESSKFNLSGFVKGEGANMSFAKILGAIVLAFLLISVTVFIKNKKKKS